MSRQHASISQRSQTFDLPQQNETRPRTIQTTSLYVMLASSLVHSSFTCWIVDGKTLVQVDYTFTETFPNLGETIQTRGPYVQVNRRQIKAHQPESTPARLPPYRAPPRAHPSTRAGRNRFAAGVDNADCETEDKAGAAVPENSSHKDHGGPANHVCNFGTEGGAGTVVEMQHIVDDVDMGDAHLGTTVSKTWQQHRHLRDVESDLPSKEVAGVPTCRQGDGRQGVAWVSGDEENQGLDEARTPLDGVPKWGKKRRRVSKPARSRFSAAVNASVPAGVSTALAPVDNTDSDMHENALVKNSKAGSSRDVCTFAAFQTAAMFQETTRQPMSVRE